MEPNQIFSIEHACGKLMVQFANYNDAMRYDDMANLFTEQASFARPTDPENFTVGKANILESFVSRSQDRVARHILSNIDIEVVSDTEAIGRCYALLYIGSPDNLAEKFGVQANESQFVGEFYEEFVLTQQGWKINKLTGKIIFTT